MTRIFIKVLKEILFLIEIFLIFRLVLKFLKANPKTWFVKNFYQLTDYLVWPFKDIFSNIFWQGKMIEISTLVAGLIYALGFLLILKIIKSIAK